ncbi:MAG: hypothetical protein ACJ8DZ_10840 [Allosphingosinicella sp.]
MKLASTLAAAAALLLSGAGLAAAASAQPPGHSRTVIRTDGERTVVRTNGDRTVVRETVVRHDNGRHYGWERGHHYGWSNNSRRTCSYVWRHHHRERICRVVRYR